MWIDAWRFDPASVNSSVPVGVTINRLASGPPAMEKEIDCTGRSASFAIASVSSQGLVTPLYTTRRPARGAPRLANPKPVTTPVCSHALVGAATGRFGSRGAPVNESGYSGTQAAKVVGRYEPGSASWKCG